MDDKSSKPVSWAAMASRNIAKTTEEKTNQSSKPQKPLSLNYPDNQQIFVGNLPGNITEQELKDFFEEYGQVVDLRINGGDKDGHFPASAFVVFKSPDGVEKTLQKGPMKYNESRLIIEKKKPRKTNT